MKYVLVSGGKDCPFISVLPQAHQCSGSWGNVHLQHALAIMFMVLMDADNDC